MSRLLIISLLAIACSTPGNNPADRLLNDVTGYSEDVRWRRWEDAAGYLVARQRECYLDRREAEEELRFVDYEIKRLKLRSDGKSAIVQVRFEWHLDTEGVVRDTTVEQLWNQDKGRWVLVSEYFLRGDDMPGVNPRILPEKNGTEAPSKPKS